MKKFLSLILALIMVLSCASLIFAEEAVTTAAPAAADETASKYYDAVKFLVNYNIMHGKGDSLGVYDNIKRYEMALFTGRIMTGWVEDSMWEDGAENYSVFVDLEGTAAENYLGAISYANQNGVIVGVGASKFAPEAGIKYEDALTMVVRALGYKDLDYPWGYIEKAVQLGLTKGINDGVNVPSEGVAYTDELKREVVAQIIYNALFAETAEGDTLAMRNFGLDLTYENVVITANDAHRFAATAELAAPGYVTYQILNADGTLAVESYTAPAEAFGLSGDHAADVALGTAYKTIFNNGKIKAVEPLEMEAIVNAGTNSKEAGKYPIQNFLADYTVAKAGSVRTIAANDGKIVVYTAGQNAEYKINDRIAVDWNTGNILEKDNLGIYQVIWYYNALLDKYFQYKKNVKANGEVEIVGLDYKTPAEMYTYYGTLAASKTYNVTNVYASLDKVPTDAYAKMRVFDTDADGAAEYGIYESYRFGKYTQANKMVIDKASSPYFEAKTYGSQMFEWKSGYNVEYYGISGFGDGHKASFDVDFYAYEGSGQVFPASKLPAGAGIAAGQGGYDEYVCLKHQGQVVKTFADSDMINDYTYAAEGTIGQDSTFLAFAAEYMLTGNNNGGWYKQYTGKADASILWSQEGQGFMLDENGDPVKDVYMIYGINPETGELTVVQTIGAYEEGADTYVATGILRAFNMSKKTVTIGDETFSIVYNDLAGAAFNSNHWDGYGYWVEGSEYLSSLFNQFVEYVVVDGVVVWAEASGAEDLAFIIVDGYAGMSSDGYYVITGYNTNNGKLEQFRIASYDGWKLGEMLYYGHIDYNWYAEQNLTEQGAVLRIQSYDPETDSWNVRRIEGIRDDADGSAVGGYGQYSTDGMNFTWFQYDYSMAAAETILFNYKGAWRTQPSDWNNPYNNNGDKLKDVYANRMGLIDASGKLVAAAAYSYDGKGAVRNMTDDDTYILIFADGEVAGAPVRVYKGKVTDDSWSIKGWRLNNPDPRLHIFIGLRAANVKGFYKADAENTLAIWFKDYTPEDPGTCKMKNGFGNSFQLVLGDSEFYQKTGYITSAAYDSTVEHGDWYLLGNTQYQITMMDLRTLTYKTFTTDTKDIQPWRVYNVQGGRVVGAGFETEDEIYDAIYGTFNCDSKIDLDHDTVGAISGVIDTTGKYNFGKGGQLIDDKDVGGFSDTDYVWYDCMNTTINKRITEAYFGHAYTYFKGYTANGHDNMMIAISVYEGETQFWLVGGGDNGKGDMASAGFPATANMNYGEYPVKRDGAVRGELYGSWYNTENNLALYFNRQSKSSDYEIAWICVVNCDATRRANNRSPINDGFCQVVYVFDNDKIH